MRKTAPRIMAALAAAAMVFTLSVAPASAAPAVQAPTVAAAAQAPTLLMPAAKKKSASIKLKRSASSYHRGTTGVKVRATVKAGSSKAKGKVTFYDGKKKIKTVKLKKGTAAIRLKSNLKPGTHKIKVKYVPSGSSKKKVKTTTKTTKVRVHNSKLKLSKTTFTISKATPSYDLPELSGSVKYKGKKAKVGWVDIYQNGKNKGGSSSKHYVGMTGASKGKFKFGNYSFLGKVQQKKPGTYKFKAFYTPTASYAEYIYSSWITVKVTK